MDFFLLCHFNNAIISLFFSQFNILVIFIGRIFQVIWSIVFAETKIGSSSQRQEKDIINYVVSEARRKKQFTVVLERHNNFGHWSQIGIFLSSHSSRHHSLSCGLDGIGCSDRCATRLQDWRPVDCQSWVIFSSEGDPRRQTTLSMLCYTQWAGFQSDKALEEASEWSCPHFQFLRHAQTGWNCSEPRHGRSWFAESVDL